MVNWYAYCMEDYGRSKRPYPKKTTPVCEDLLSILRDPPQASHDLSTERQRRLISPSCGQLCERVCVPSRVNLHGVCAFSFHSPNPGTTRARTHTSPCDGRLNTLLEDDSGRVHVAPGCRGSLVARLPPLEPSS